MTDLIITRPVTPEYERGHVATFGSKPDRFCPGCGRLPSFCECPRVEAVCKCGSRLVTRLPVPAGCESVANRKEWTCPDCLPDQFEEMDHGTPRTPFEVSEYGAHPMDRPRP